MDDAAEALVEIFDEADPLEIFNDAEDLLRVRQTLTGATYRLVITEESR